MLGAIISSVFVIYLYRKLNATAGAEVVEGAVPEDSIDRELARLDDRLYALENILAGKNRRIAP